MCSKIIFKKVKLLVDNPAGLVYPFFVMRKYTVLNQEGVIETFIQKVGEADHVALDAAMTLAGRSGEDVIEIFEDGTESVVWEFEQDGLDAYEARIDACQADADSLASAGWGTDEDYGGGCEHL